MIRPRDSQPSEGGRPINRAFSSRSLCRSLDATVSRLKFIKADEISAVLEMNSKGRATHINRLSGRWWNRGGVKKKKKRNRGWEGEKGGEEDTGPRGGGGTRNDQKERGRARTVMIEEERKTGRVANESDNSVCRVQAAWNAASPGFQHS